MLPPLVDCLVSSCKNCHDAVMREYRKRNPHVQRRAVKKHDSKNPLVAKARIAAAYANARARKLGARGTLTYQDVLSVWWRDGLWCLSCHGLDLGIDHVVPLGACVA